MEEIILEQDFYQPENALVGQINQFTIFSIIPQSLVKNNEIEYLSIADDATKDFALLGVKYVLHKDNRLEIQTRIWIRQGSLETFQLAVDEIVNQLAQERIEAIKNTISIEM